MPVLRLRVDRGGRGARVTGITSALARCGGTAAMLIVVTACCSFAAMFAATARSLQEPVLRRADPRVEVPVVAPPSPSLQPMRSVSVWSDDDAAPVTTLATDVAAPALQVSRRRQKIVGRASPTPAAAPTLTLAAPTGPAAMSPPLQDAPGENNVQWNAFRRGTGAAVQRHFVANAEPEIVLMPPSRPVVVDDAPVLPRVAANPQPPLMAQPEQSLVHNMVVDTRHRQFPGGVDPGTAPPRTVLPQFTAVDANDPRVAGPLPLDRGVHAVQVNRQPPLLPPIVVPMAVPQESPLTPAPALVPAPVNVVPVSASDRHGDVDVSSLTAFVASGGRLPVVVLTSDRASMLEKTLTSLLSVRGLAREAVVVYQHGTNVEVAAVVARFGLRSRQNGNDVTVQGGGERIAAHYKYSLTQMFDAETTVCLRKLPLPRMLRGHG